MSFSVRRLVAEDHAALRAIRLSALSLEPHAFGSTFEREAAFSNDVWRHRLRPDGNPHFGCFDGDGALVGLAAGLIDADGDGVPELVAMWVDPEARGNGTADALVDAVAQWAGDEGCASIRLHVTDGNDRAEGMYRRTGFVRTGRVFPRERDNVPEIEMERTLIA